MPLLSGSGIGSLVGYVTPSLPITASLRTPLNSVETGAFNIEVNFENADVASITADSLSVITASRAQVPVSLVSATNVSGTVEATFTATPPAAGEDFYSIEVPAGAATNGGLSNLYTGLGAQEIQLPTYGNVATSLPAYPSAIESTQNHSRVTFDWSPVANEVLQLFKGARTTMTGVYGDDATRGTAEVVIELNTDLNEIHFKSRHVTDTPYYHHEPTLAGISADFSTLTSPIAVEVTNRRGRISVTATGANSTVLSASCNDGRGAPLFAWGWRATTVPASVSNVSLDAIAPDTNYAWDSADVPKFRLINSTPIICGGSQGIPDRFFNIPELVDTVGTHLEGITPKKKRWFGSRDHAAPTEANDIIAAWTDDVETLAPDANGVTTVISDTNSQEETPRLVYYDATAQLFYFTTHRLNTPSPDYQSTVVRTTSDLVTFSSPTTVLPADIAGSETQLDVRHTGYYNLDPAQLRGISLGPNGLEGASYTLEDRAAYRAWLISSFTPATVNSANAWIREGSPDIESNDRDNNNAALVQFFQWNGEKYAIATYTTPTSDWELTGGKMEMFMVKVSDDLKQWSRRKVRIGADKPFWAKYNERVCKIFVDGNRLLVYVAYVRGLGNPANDPSVDSPMWIGCWEHDMINNSFEYAPPSGLGFEEDWSGGASTVLAGRVPAKNNNLGNTWEYLNGNFLSGDEYRITAGGYLDRISGPNVEWGGMKYDVGDQSLIDFEIVATFYNTDETDPTALFGIFFDCDAAENNMKAFFCNSQGRADYFERVAGVGGIVVDHDFTGSQANIESRDVILVVRKIGNQIEFLRNMVPVPGLPTVTMNGNTKVAFGMRGKRHRQTGMSFRTL